MKRYWVLKYKRTQRKSWRCRAPVHDWTRVDAGIFHDFHHAWIEVPTIPLFLTSEEYVPVPLEASYQAAVDEVRDVWREAVLQASARPS
jgi:hypothetical protein